VARIVVFFGLIASGKSTLAEGYAKQYDLPCYNTDRVRKELAGIDPSQRRPDGFQVGIYTPEFSRKTYQAMLDRAAADIGSGLAGVVLDGSYNSRSERDMVRSLAAEKDAQCVFIHCVCGEDEVKRRLAERAADPLAVSDGRWEIYQDQKKAFQDPVELPASALVTLNTEQPVAELLQILAATLNTVH